MKTEDEIIVWIQTAAFWQQGRLQQVNESLLVDFSLLRVDENFFYVFPFHDKPASTSSKTDFCGDRMLANIVL